MSGVPARLQEWVVASSYDPGPVSGAVGPNAVSTPGTEFSKTQLSVTAALKARRIR